MAELMFVCVHEDVAYAEALAAMFDADGFCIGDRSSDEVSVRVLLWSAEACQSRSFHRAATAAIAVGPVLVACVGATPAAPEGVDAAYVFDLLDWDGDPASPALASLRDAAGAIIEPKQAQRAAPTQQVWSGARIMGASAAAEWGLATWPDNDLDAAPQEGPEPVAKGFAPARLPAMARALRALALIALVGGAALTGHLFTGVTNGAVPASRPSSLEVAFASARAAQEAPSYTPDAPRHTLASVSLRDVVVEPLATPARVSHRRVHQRASSTLLPQLNFQPAAYTPLVASEPVAPAVSAPIAIGASAKPHRKLARI